MKEFGRAIEDVLAEQAGEERPYLGETVKIAGREINLYEPSAGGLAYMVTVAESYSGDTVHLVASLLTFIGELMERDDQQHLLRAIRTGALDEDAIIELFQDIVETVGARPTQSSVASSPSRRATGQPSTANSRRAKSTPSATSRRTASSTSSTRA